MKFLVSPTCNFILSIIKLKFKSYALARNVIYLKHNEENFNIKISKEFGTNLNANLKGNVLLRRESKDAACSTVFILSNFRNFTEIVSSFVL